MVRGVPRDGADNGAPAMVNEGFSSASASASVRLRGEEPETLPGDAAATRFRAILGRELIGDAAQMPCRRLVVFQAGPGRERHREHGFGDVAGLIALLEQPYPDGPPGPAELAAHLAGVLCRSHGSSGSLPEYWKPVVSRSSGFVRFPTASSLRRRPGTQPRGCVSFASPPRASRPGSADRERWPARRCRRARKACRWGW